MSVTVRELTEELTKKYPITLAAGESGLSNPVRWVYTVEDLAFDKILHGSELVFTTGIAHRDGGDWLDEFIDGLIAHGSAGLVLNTGPYITELPDGVRARCDSVGLPLFTIPWEISLIDVMYDCSHYLMKSEENSMSLTKTLRGIILNRRSTPAQLRFIERSGFHSSHLNNPARFCVLALLPDDDTEPTRQLHSDADRLLTDEGRRFSLFTLQDMLVCVLIVSDQEDGVECARMLSQDLCEKLPQVSVGVSEPFREIDDLPTASDQAIVAVRTARKNGSGFMKYSATGIYKLLYAISGPEIALSYVDELLGKIKEYDRTHDSDYLETLRVFMKHNGSVQNTAAELKIHRNTVNNKMRLIRERFGLDFGYECVTALTIAFTLDELYG
ncbi:MAG: PucR family transcriptional regulator [Candidatus Flemingiibacterium sp.]